MKRLLSVYCLIASLLTGPILAQLPFERFSNPRKLFAIPEENPKGPLSALPSAAHPLKFQPRTSTITEPKMGFREDDSYGPVITDPKNPFNFRANPAVTAIQATSQIGRVFSVKAGPSGARGDDATSDIAAIKRAVTALNNNGGGKLFFPTGRYLIPAGQPGVDTNYVNYSGTNYALLNITIAKPVIELQDPQTSIHVQASYLCQGLGGQGSAPCRQYLWYFGSAFIDYFSFNGNYGRMDFDLTGGAAFTNVANSENPFVLMTGAMRGQQWENVTVSGFPQLGLVSGDTNAQGEKYANAYFHNFFVEQYGAGGDDLCIYTYGYATYDHCTFKTTRYSSHGLYWGADSPYVWVHDCIFDGQNNLASPDTAGKFGIQVRQGSGTNPIRDAWIENNVFIRGRNSVFVSHDGGGNVERFIFRGNKFIGNASLNFGSTVGQTSIAIYRPVGCVWENNYWYLWQNGVTVNSISTGTSNTFNYNYSLDSAGMLSVYMNNSTFIGNTYRQSTPTNDSIKFAIRGNRNKIQYNDVYDGGTVNSVAFLIQGISGGGSDFSHNSVYSTVSQGYGTIIWGLTCTACQFTNNTVDHIGGGSISLSGDGITVSDNQSNKSITVDGTGSGYSKAHHNTLTAGTLSTTGLVVPTDNIIPAWGTVTGAVSGKGNVVAGVKDYVTATYAASYTPNGGIARTVSMTLTGDSTWATPTGMLVGDELTIIGIQDATGGRTLTLSSSGYDISWTPVTTANKKNILTCTWTGTKCTQTRPAMTGL